LMALVRATDKKTNRAELFIVGINQGENGKTIAGSWVSLQSETRIFVGRKDKNDYDTPKVTSEELFGSDKFNKTVSRKHVALTVTSEGIVKIEDMSVNGTWVWGNEVS